MNNSNCDGQGRNKCTPGQVRVMPSGGDSNLILCKACHHNEILFRLERNLELCKENQFDLPKWKSLKIYEE